MKQVLIIILIGTVALATGCRESSSSTEARSSMPADEVVIPAEGMVCIACVSRVNRTLSGMEGVHSAEADLLQRQVRVRHDAGAISADQLAAAVREMGYHVEEPAQPHLEPDTESADADDTH